MNDGLPKLGEVLADHSLTPKKNLGQNFLLDLNITNKIARLAGSLDDHNVIEIGPGPGGLTRALLFNGAKKIYAFERDERVIPILEQISTHYNHRLTVKYEDALKTNIFENIEEPVRIVSNLPYNIGTALLISWLTEDEWLPRWASLTLMFQKEVAERITAKPGSKAWGRLAVLAQWRADARIVYHLPPQAFTPPPKVASAVVHITPTKPKIDVKLKSLERVTNCAFQQKRKMLRSSLKPLFENVSQTLETIGIDPTRRAETLSLEEFGAIAKLIS